MPFFFYLFLSTFQSFVNLWIQNLYTYITFFDDTHFLHEHKDTDVYDVLVEWGKKHKKNTPPKTHTHEKRSGY